ncbi:unnamed protein product, partial [Ixodes pacificus]
MFLITVVDVTRTLQRPWKRKRGRATRATLSSATSTCRRSEVGQTTPPSRVGGASPEPTSWRNSEESFLREDATPPRRKTGDGRPYAKAAPRPTSTTARHNRGPGVPRRPGVDRGRTHIEGLHLRSRHSVLHS